MTIAPERVVREQTRARYPDESGFVERDGVRLYYEVYGTGETTVFLMPVSYTHLTLPTNREV